MHRVIALPLTAAALLNGLTACSAGPSAGSVEVSPNIIIIDVRTYEEYSGGHLEGS